MSKKKVIANANFHLFREVKQKFDDEGHETERRSKSYDAEQGKEIPAEVWGKLSKEQQETFVSNGKVT